MTGGIFNPYSKSAPKKDKPNFMSSMDADNPVDTEPPPEIVPEVTIDSPKYRMVLRINMLEKIAEKLGETVVRIKNEAPGHLLKHGVFLLPLGETYQMDPHEAHMKTPSGHLMIYVGDVEPDKVMDVALQRMAHLFYTWNKPDVLDKLGVVITARG